MISFMVIGAPRSGSTWCSNWLTTDKTMCFHDLTMTTPWPIIDMVQSSRPYIGLADTGIGLLHDLLNRHSAHKVILHRDMDEIRESLASMGAPMWDQKTADRYERSLVKIKGMHVDWRDIFVKPKPIWDHLLPHLDFDAERHRQLIDMNVQPQVANLKINSQCLTDFVNAIRESA